MSNILKRSFLVLVWLILLLPGWTARATMTYGEVFDYDVTMELREDGVLEVQERIAHRFDKGDNQALTRVIPRQSQVGNQSVRIKLSQVEVQDATGQKIDFRLQRSRADYRIEFISHDSPQTYFLKYTVKSALLSAAPEVLLGIAWLGQFEANDVRQTKLTLELPKNLADRAVRAECISGADAMRSCVSSRFKYAQLDEISALIFIDDRLNLGQRIVYNLGLPEEVLTENKWGDWLVNGLKILGVGLVVLGFVLYRRRGRQVRTPKFRKQRELINKIKR